jgi:hypothetical protein
MDNLYWHSDAYLQIPAALLAEHQEGLLDTADILVYLALLHHQGQKEFIWPSLFRLATMIRRSPKTVQRSLKALERGRHIQKIGRHASGTLKMAILSRVVRGKVTYNKPHSPSRPPKPELPPVPPPQIHEKPF